MQDASSSVVADRPGTSRIPETENTGKLGTPSVRTSSSPPSGNQSKRSSDPAPSRSEGWLIFLGIVLPVITIGFECLTRICAETLFDPMPSWLHVFLLVLVPAGNLLIVASIRQNRADRVCWLVPLQGFILVVAAAYTLLLAPLIPFAPIGVVFYGLGIIPLAPPLALLGCGLGLSRLKALAEQEKKPMPRVWPAMFASAALLIVGPLHGIFTNWALSMSTSTDRAAAQRGISLLRNFGSNDHLLRACYNNSFSVWQNWPPKIQIQSQAPGATAVTPEIARNTYYRVTGQAYNSVPAPNGKGPGRSGRGSWNFDPDLGGTKVANRVPGLSMISSRMDGKADVAAGTSYVEWTMIFKNVALSQSEARAQIELPPGAAVSRLTLWIDGQPCEAAFGGRSQVRAAYQEVAVQQRRDPVLVTTSGPNRVLMQCFPVQPNGGEMKVRVGITAPLKIVDGSRSEVLLPRMLEWNFEHDSSMAHELWLEADQPLSVAGKAKGQAIRQRLSDADLQKAPQIVAEHPAADEIWTDDPTDPTFAIRQVIRQRKAQAPG
ncbi:MAG: hypothetical protein EOP84_19450, partial [Verrucomicrobiaceae bacterium]